MFIFSIVYFTRKRCRDGSTKMRCCARTKCIFVSYQRMPSLWTTPAVVSVWNRAFCNIGTLHWSRWCRSPRHLIFYNGPLLRVPELSFDSQSSQIMLIYNKEKIIINIVIQPDVQWDPKKKNRFRRLHYVRYQKISNFRDASKIGTNHHSCVWDYKSKLKRTRHSN